MTARRPRPPLTQEKLNELALAYVGRFATTRAKLGRYLTRKVRERGWDGAQGPDVDAIVARCARNGFIDDAAFALSKAQSLTGRGYGAARVAQSLRAAGVDEQDSHAARAYADREKVDAALKMARRKRFGPFSAEPMERAAREKALAAMARAGHSFSLAKAIVALQPGSEPDLALLAETAGRNID